MLYIAGMNNSNIAPTIMPTSPAGKEKETSKLPLPIERVVYGHVIGCLEGAANIYVTAIDGYREHSTAYSLQTEPLVPVLISKKLRSILILCFIRPDEAWSPILSLHHLPPRRVQATGETCPQVERAVGVQQALYRCSMLRPFFSVR